MAASNERVFQLSLTEIAFVVCFILLLLLGYLVFREQAKAQAAESALATHASLEATRAALSAAKSQLEAQMKASGVKDPNAVIAQLVATSELKHERDVLKQRLDELDAQLTALAAIKSQIESSTADAGRAASIEQIESALTFGEQVRLMVDESAKAGHSGSEGPNSTAAPKINRTTGSGEGRTSTAPASVSNREAIKAIRDALAVQIELRTQMRELMGAEVRPDNESTALSELFLNARAHLQASKAGTDVATVTRENANLRGQVAFLNKRLDARGGRDYPPCWVNEQGAIEFLFSVDLSNDAFSATPAWPAKRESDARALPNVDRLLRPTPLSSVEFSEAARGILDWSKRQDPECRHYVHLRSKIQDAIQSDRARLLVEGFFYKDEARR